MCYQGPLPPLVPFPVRLFLSFPVFPPLCAVVFRGGRFFFFPEERQVPVTTVPQFFFCPSFVFIPTRFLRSVFFLFYLNTNTRNRAPMYLLPRDLFFVPNVNLSEITVLSVGALFCSAVGNTDFVFLPRPDFFFFGFNKYPLSLLLFWKKSSEFKTPPLRHSLIFFLQVHGGLLSLCSNPSDFCARSVPDLSFFLWSVVGQPLSFSSQDFMALQVRFQSVRRFLFPLT